MELLAVIVLLAIVASITGMAVSGLIKKANEKSYDILISDIKGAAELYYQECEYMSNDNEMCEVSGEITLAKLVQYGFLTRDEGKDDGVNNYAIINPNTDKDISRCKVKISANNGVVKVEPVGSMEGCPGEY